MPRYQILIEYVGTNFIGWQVQKKGNSIQGLIQKKISKVLIHDVARPNFSIKLIEDLFDAPSLFN